MSVFHHFILSLVHLRTGVPLLKKYLDISMGEEAVVYFTRNLSEEGLNRFFLKVDSGLTGHL